MAPMNKATPSSPVLAAVLVVGGVKCEGRDIHTLARSLTLQEV